MELSFVKAAEAAEHESVTSEPVTHVRMREDFEKANSYSDIERISWIFMSQPLSALPRNT